MNMSLHWSEHKAVDPLLAVLKWVIGFAIAYQAAVMTWLIVDQSTLVLPEPAKSPVQKQIATNKQDLASWNLFGEADQKDASPKEAINAPKTRLRLALMGVFVAKNEQQSSAIIAEQGREGEFFKVGDRVQGRARLSQVYADKVILDNSGKLETLTFEDAAKLAGSIVVQKQPKSAAKPARTNSAGFKRQLKGIKTPEQFVDFAKEQLEDPEQALKNLGLTSNGSGYVLSGATSMLTRIGMKPGDKLISVNGSALGDPEQDKLLIDDVFTSGAAKIVIERGSRRMTINHSF
jgi:general secretion pathway protein C